VILDRPHHRDRILDDSRAIKAGRRRLDRGDT
jgi:hypothetical protein